MTESSSKSRNDNLMMARLREELDMIGNAKKEDRIVITGLTNTTIMPAQGDEKKKWLHDMVGRVFHEIDPSLKGKILFVNHGKRNGHNIPMVEVRVDTKENAIALRKAFVAKKKMGHQFGKLHLANSVSLGTRVRTDILRGIAAQFSVEGQLSMFVSAYNSRPVIHIKEMNGSSYALTFADAVARYGNDLQEDYLIDAYRKIGSAFKGQLEQQFVVLREDEVARVSSRPSVGAAQRGTPRGGPQFRGGRGRGSNPRQFQLTTTSQGQKRPFEGKDAANGTGGKSAYRPIGLTQNYSLNQNPNFSMIQNQRSNAPAQPTVPYNMPPPSTVHMAPPVSVTGFGTGLNSMVNLQPQFTQQTQNQSQSFTPFHSYPNSLTQAPQPQQNMDQQGYFSHNW